MKQSAALLCVGWLLLTQVACGVSETIVQIGGETDTLSITVVDENLVSIEQLQLEVGDTARLGASARNALGSFLGTVTAEWYSTDSIVASVSDSGVVVGESPGDAEIVATHDGRLAVMPTVVTDPASPPPPGTVVAEWYSLFEGSTWTDNGKWTNYAGNTGGDPDQIFTIFTTALDPDVPGGRGWRSQQVGTWFAQMWQALSNTSGPSVPAVGQFVNWRFFVKVISSDPDGNYHSIGTGRNALSSNGAGGLVFTWVGGGSPQQPQITFSGNQGPSPYATPGSTMPRNEWVRVEINIERTGTSTYQFQLRFYNQAGTIVADESTMTDTFGSGSPLAGVTINHSTPADFTLMDIGVPGLGSVQAVGYEMERLAAFAAITDNVAHVNMPYGYFSHEN